MQFCDICFCTLCAISNAREHRKSDNKIKS